MKKVIELSTKPIIYNIKDVNRLNFHIFFPIKYKKSNIANKILTKRMLSTSSNKYNNPLLFNSVIEDKYIMDYRVDSKTCKNYELMNFYLSIPKENLIDEFDLEEALKVFHEFIFNPYADNGSFNEEHFNMEKDYLINRENDFPSSIDEYAYDKYEHFIDPDEKHDIHHDTYLNLINKVTAKSTYKYYEEAILNNDYVSFITGGIDDEDRILSIYNKIFKQDEKKIHKELEFFDIDTYDEYQYKDYKTKYNQTMLFLNYHIDDYKEEEFMKITQLYYLLNAKENDLIFHKLRNDNNLIYHCNCSLFKLYGNFEIIVYLDKKDINKVKELINEVFNDLKDEDYYNECMNRMIKAISYDLLSNEDNPFNSFNNYLTEVFSYDLTLDKKLDALKNHKYDDFMKFIDRIKLSHELVVEGGDSNE